MRAQSAFIVLVSIFLAAGSGVLAPSGDGLASTAAWYDPAWSQRKDVVVTNNSSTALNGHQLRIDLTTQNFNFSQTQPNGADLRLTDSSGVTLIPLYIEHFDASAGQATLWTRISLAASGSTALYLYYSNPTATSVSNPLAVFDFWDQFRPSVAVDSYVRFDTHEVNPVLTPGPTGAWDQSLQEKVQVLQDATGWKMYYTGYANGVQSTSHIGLATSPDGKTWTRYANNPVVSRAEQDQDPAVLKGPDGKYYMYTERNDDSIDRFVSPDGYTWTLQGQVEASAASPVVWIEGTTWYMLYERMTGLNGIFGTCTSTAPCYINLATSLDGTLWTDSPANPVLTENDTTVPDSVANDGSVYHLYYHRSDAGAWDPWQAVSTNLTTWSNRQEFLTGYSSPVVIKDQSGQIRLYIWGLNLDDNYYLFYGKDALRTLWTGLSDPNGTLQLTSAGLQISGYEIASATYQVANGIVEARVLIDAVEGSIFARSTTGAGLKSSQGYGFSNADFASPNQVWNTALTYQDQPFASNPLAAPIGQWLVERFTLNGSSLLGERIIDSTGALQASIAGSHSVLTQGLLGVKAYSRTRQATLDWVRVRKIVPNGVSVAVTNDQTSGVSVAITNPLDGSIVAAGSTVTIAATASSNAGINRVEFSINGSLKCTVSAAPYTCVWHVPGKRNATYTLQATAYDNAGATAPATVTVKAQ